MPTQSVVWLDAGGPLPVARAGADFVAAGSAQSGIVLVRYCIPLVPVSLLFVACGIQAALEFIVARATLQPALQTATAFAFVSALAITGPLPQCYVAPDNFTSHGAYQHRYGTIDWQHSFFQRSGACGFHVEHGRSRGMRFRHFTDGFQPSPATGPSLNIP